MYIEKHYFYNNRSQKIAAKIYKNSDSTKGVIFSHGLFSTKDGYKITMLAEDIVNLGFTLLTFDFSFVGESEGNISELSILQEVDDLNSSFIFFKKYGIENIHLIGSSMGGLVSLLFSSVIKGICSQSLIAAPVVLNELICRTGIKNIDTLPEDGATEIDGILINNTFFKEIKKIAVERAIANTHIPTLLIHGFLDTIVPVKDAVYLNKSLTCEKRMVLIEDGEHNLTRDSDLKIISQNILEWLIIHN